MTKKEIKTIIIFDDAEYSPEECSYLYGRFFHALSKLAKKEIPESFIQKIFTPEIFRKNK